MLSAFLTWPFAVCLEAGHNLIGNLCRHEARYCVATAPIVRLFELLTDGGEVAYILLYKGPAPEVARTKKIGLFIYYHLEKTGYRRETLPQMV